MISNTIEYRVPYADTDQMGVVYYGNYLTFFERARNELMRRLGYTYKECESEGWMLPVTHAEVDYRRPAKYDRIEIACEVRRKGEEQILVSGFTRHAFVSTADFRPCPPPERLLRMMEAEEGGNAAAG